jgi:tetratricopeptide (TPR) repeat protein
MGDKVFFDADFQEATVGGQWVGRESIIGMVPVHVVGRLWPEEGLVRLAFLDSSWVEDHGSETLRRSVLADMGVVAATTEELRKFMLENPDNEKAVVPLFYLCRPGTDCSLRAMNEELRRRPEDKQVVENAAAFFRAHGDYTKAVELWRRAVPLAPKDAATHVYLGEALLFTRDFAGARKEFTAVPHPTLKKPSACRDMMWSYFLEGKWVEVPQAAAKCRAMDDFWTDEAILLTYHSLRRLDRRNEAEAYLKEEARKFVVAMNDHALLLDAEGRTGYPCPGSGEEEDLRCKYFVSLNEEKRGGTPRSWLEGIVNKAPQDSLFGLSAKIELERLASTQSVGTQPKPDQ